MQKNKTKQNKTKQNKTKQNKTKQNKTKQNKTKQNKNKKKNKKKKKTIKKKKKDSHKANFQFETIIRYCLIFFGWNIKKTQPFPLTVTDYHRPIYAWGRCCFA